MSLMTHDDLRALAHEVALDLVGAVPAGPAPNWAAYRDWVAQGYAAEMHYLSRPDALSKRQDPRRIVPDAKTVIIVSASYAGPPAPQLPPLSGRISRYVWGPPAEAQTDYHRWMLERLKALIERLEVALGQPITARTYVDTGPILERDWAQAAGLGWIGKNTTLINPTLGSYTFLGSALLDVALPAPPMPRLPSCGTCTRCLDACPTGALVSPGVLDARRCLSYLTIENRGPIPEQFREALGTRLFGCDTCQVVCPWNRKPIAAQAGQAVPKLATLYLPDLLKLDAAAFRARFRTTPIWRATPAGLARNAAIVLGNLGDPAAATYLKAAAAEHPSPMVREAAAWAIHRLDAF